MVILFIDCEGTDKFYRPDLPEKLCSIGIIEVDDSVRYISFEKSYQSEYPSNLNDSLREFQFSISSDDGEIIKSRIDTAIKNYYKYKVPNNITFRTGGKYYLRATEKSTAEISAEVVVPDPPSGLKLISIEKEIISLSKPLECSGYYEIKTVSIGISFKNNKNKRQFFALLFQGIGSAGGPSSSGGRGFLDFTIRESDAPGFFATFHGPTMSHFTFWNTGNYNVIKSPVSAYFIDGEDINYDTCYIKLLTRFQDEQSFFETFRSFQIKLLTIPEELYLFEKRLNVYEKVSKDPFSEPIYLQGNLKGGDGIFAICRSARININLTEQF